MKISVSGTEPLSQLRQVLLDIMELQSIEPAIRIEAKKDGDIRILTFTTRKEDQ